MNPGYNPQNQGYGSNANPGSSPGSKPYGAGALNSVANASPEVRANFIRSTYLLFVSGILCSLLVGALTLSSYAITMAALSAISSPLLAILLIVGGSMAAQAIARTPGLNLVGLYGFTGLIGFLFAPVLRIYEMQQPGIVGQAAFLSVLVFGSLSAYALVSKTNFSFLGGMIFVGMIAIIGAGIANLLIFHSAGIGYWLAWATLFMSSGFVLWRTSRMVHEYAPNENVAAALGLFISFFNIFLSILRILGGNRR